jgi:E3 ubiquitin-protein ligase RBBP6
MASVIYFKLKNATQQQSVFFDGSVIQVGDVKRLVAAQQGLGPEGAAELTLSDPGTGDAYADDAKAIPRNTLVVVKRAPQAFKPLLAEAGAPAVTAGGGGGAPAPADAGAGGDDFGGDLYSEQPVAPVIGEDESRALAALMAGSAASWSREVRAGAARGRGRGGRGGRGQGAPLDYRCPRCDAVGAHWVSDCPTQGDAAYDRKRVRPPVGIPMTRLAHSAEGGLVLPGGLTGTLVANEDSFAREMAGLTGGGGEAAAAPYAGGVSAAAAAARAARAAEAAPPRLALDDKPAVEVAAAPASPAAAPAAAPARPAGCGLGPYARAALLPRGPPDFVARCYDRAEPLGRADFERGQDEWRRRVGLPPIRRPRSRSRSRERRRRRSRSRDRKRSRSRSRRDRSRSRSRSRREGSRSESARPKGEAAAPAPAPKEERCGRERERAADKPREKEREGKDAKGKDAKGGGMDVKSREAKPAPRAPPGFEPGALPAKPAAKPAKVLPPLPLHAEPEVDYSASEGEGATPAAAAHKAAAHKREERRAERRAEREPARPRDEPRREKCAEPARPRDEPKGEKRAEAPAAEAAAPRSVFDRLGGRADGGGGKGKARKRSRSPPRERRDGKRR